MRDLENERILVTSEEWALELEKVQKGIELQNQDSQFYFSDESMALKLVEHGRGICILPKSFASIGNNTLNIEIKSFEKKYYRTWGMIYPKSKNLANAVQKFLNHTFYMHKKNPIFVDSAIRVDCKI